MIDLDNAELPRTVRPLPKQITGHILSIGDLKSVARWAAGRDGFMISATIFALSGQAKESSPIASRQF